MSSKPDPFKLIREAQTCSENHDLETEDIIARLEEWREFCDFEVIDAEADSVTLKFKSLPDDLDSFAEEIYDFAPDVVDQEFGAIDEEDEDEELGELTDDLDPDDPDFGLKVLVNSLRRDKRLQLWWD